jgi:plastocyanin
MKKREVFGRPARGFVVAGLVAIGVGVGTLGGAPAAQAQLGAAKPVNISVRALTFVPKKFDAKVKQKINFVWKENVAHNIVFDKKIKSPTQNKGSWTTSFDKAGTYKFKCTLHPGMNGEVKVK